MIPILNTLSTTIITAMIWISLPGFTCSTGRFSMVLIPIITGTGMTGPGIHGTMTAGILLILPCTGGGEWIPGMTDGTEDSMAECMAPCIPHTVTGEADGAILIMPGVVLITTIGVMAD
jgi:hypothetical protein